MSPASSLSPIPLEWPPCNINSPAFASQTVAACKINSDRHNRKVSMQSIASDDSNYPEIDAHVLVVSHGGSIREIIRYLVEELGVTTPGGKGAALRPCPNTGFSTFFVSVEEDASEVSVTCLNLHSKDHLLEHSLVAPVNIEALWVGRNYYILFVIFCFVFVMFFCISVSFTPQKSAIDAIVFFSVYFFVLLFC